MHEDDVQRKNEECITIPFFDGQIVVEGDSFLLTKLIRSHIKTTTKGTAVNNNNMYNAHNFNNELGLPAVPSLREATTEPAAKKRRTKKKTGP